MNKNLQNYKIYGRKIGRKNNKLFHNEFFNQQLLSINKDIKINKNNILDVGSGNGENAIYLSQKNQQSFIIACDIFFDGNINLCNYLYEFKIKNIKIYNQNVLKLFDNLKLKKCFNEIWILFPDPWPKNRHHKRRLINDIFFKQLYNFLKIKGYVFIATDSISYLNSIIKTIYKNKDLFKWENNTPPEWSYNSLNYANTKFFKKAINSNRVPFFIKLSKNNT